ncbi:hypothetical protein HYH02_011782 [Chlamydomonas schloesseri]|uniref:Uncharacterized protein n=1 Tax=Chlamydomonas schloesseri TaxID=2026947 RepID=A0A835SY61_9CHLO|nr:hypothetical protein HYH02_011782 [Chlamydomonas schloesseri]|eukprot:KAG2435487.1 hypothetical protein HYH02_011782 [Chlamydomonas schloesseri]
MEVDMHSDPGMWRAKIDKLQSLLRNLGSCVIHVNAAITPDMLCNNLALVRQLHTVSDLRLHLRDGAELPPAAAAELGAMRQLTSLSIIGGGLGREAAHALLAGLAAGCAAAAAAAGGGGGGCSAASAGGQLRSLTLLPQIQHGLCDDDMGVLARVSSLERLEFRAHRLSSAGLAALGGGLPRLERLAISSLDSDSGYDLATLERLAALAELELALDQAPLGNESRRALCAVRPGRSLSLSFRYTERAQGLLADCGNLLSNLTHLDVGACRVGSEALFEAVAALTGLRELRMAVYSNTDHSIHCQLSRLSRLEALQRFALEKRKAYFPEARRFAESSITVPVTAAGLGTLAARWTRLQSLRLALSRRDYNPESLAMLSSFTGLKELGLVVERYPGGGGGGGNAGGAQQAAGSSMVAGSPGTCADPQLSTSAGGGISCSPGSAGAGLGHGRLFRREPPPTLDLAWLPVGLQALELNSLLLELSAPPPEALAAAGPGDGGDDGGEGGGWGQGVQAWRDGDGEEAEDGEERALGDRMEDVLMLDEEDEQEGGQAAAALAVGRGLLPGPAGYGLSGLSLGSGPALPYTGSDGGEPALPVPVPLIAAAARAALPAPEAMGPPALPALPPCEQPVPVAAPAPAAPPRLPSPAARAPLPPTRAPPPRLPLSQLTCLDVESCVVRPPLLAEVAHRCSATLRSLRLVGVVGLTDAALADCLEQLPALRSLTISATGNRAVTQACLAALSGGRRAPCSASMRLPLPLRGGPSLGPAHPLRALSLETDDLTSRGPELAVLAPLSALRHLRLSCTDKTAERALGSLRVLQDALPYCHCDMVWTSPRETGL